MADRGIAGLTGLAPFAGRPAKKLSGGMRQKLGLCCSLIHDPELLILDEPTTGVDPLSRRQFWELVGLMRQRHMGMSVVVATAYMEEAEQFDWLIAMNAGSVLATGTPADLKHAHGADTVEEAFIAVLPDAQRKGHTVLKVPPRTSLPGEPVIVAHDLTCRFGDFTAVNKVSFTIERGEIFGFLGSNGCGKSTTMKMLTGLLPATSGQALLFGHPVNAGGIAARARIGYMSQSFSLYTELTVRQNLDLHAHLFHLPRDKSRARIDGLVAQFGLGDYLDQRTLDLPLGIRQRLSLAVAIVHEPEILILDEPTSGVDPLERDRFWTLLIDLSRNQGVTIFVSTHFMNEAERCDRVSLMDAGRVLATGTPAELVKARGAGDLEAAFISWLEEAKGIVPAVRTDIPRLGSGGASAPVRRRGFSPRRLLAYTIREALELLRDPVRLGFGLFGTALLMVVFGFGVSTDVNNLTFAVLDRDQTVESRAYLEELRGSAYFIEKKPISDYNDQEVRLRNGRVEATIEIPPGFGKDIKRGRPAWVSATVDGAMPFRAQTMRGYLEGVHQLYLIDPMVSTTQPAPAGLADIEIRFKYNQDFDSIYAMVPANISLMLALFPAILMALAIVREKELGSITNLYVTPVTRLEFLIGKQLPYVAIAMANFVILFLMALFLFQVPLKGSLPTACDRRTGLRHDDDGLRHAGLGLHQDADRSAVRHGDSDRDAGDAVLRHDDPGIVVDRHGQDHGPDVPDDILRADQRRHVHQGTWLRRSGRRPDEAGVVRAGAAAAEYVIAAKAGTLMFRTWSNIFWLGTKELRSFLHDYTLIGLVIYAFSLAVIMSANSASQELHNASIAFADEDHSELSHRIAHAFLPPLFQPPGILAVRDIVPAMNAGRVHVRGRHPALLRAGRAGRTRSGHPNRCRCDRDGAGRPGFRRCAADHRHRNRHVRSEGRKYPAVDGQPECKDRFQPQRDDRLVHQCHGDHQQCNDAGDHHVGGRDHPRARARHDGPPAGDAADAVRDRHVQGLRERTGDHRRGRAFALRCRAHDPSRSDCRIDPAVHGGRGHLSVLRDGCRHLPGHRHTLHAAVGAAVHAGVPADEHAVRQQHAAGEHASLVVHDHGGVAIDALRVVRAVDLYRGAGIGIVWPEFLAVASVGGLFFALALWRFRKVASQAG